VHPSKVNPLVRMYCTILHFFLNKWGTHCIKKPNHSTSQAGAGNEEKMSRGQESKKGENEERKS